MVDEDDLSDGSDTTKESLTANGTFTVASPDGIATLVIDGRTVVSNGAFTATSWTTPLGNTISITGYNPTTGVVTYTYTLLDNESHPAANGENSLFEDFAVTLTDLDGDSASDTLSVNIIDDVPTARNDTDTLPPASSSETGNVITGVGTTSGNAGADTLGADAAAVTGLRAGNAGAFSSVGSTVTGQFGTLTLNADGSYTYTRSGNGGGGQTDTFSYQLTDGDGDVSTATLVISIPDRPATVTSVPTTGGGTVVNEAGLPPVTGDPAGTGEIADGNPNNESNQSEVTTGTITFSTPDGFGSLQINNVTITGVIGQPIPTTQGNLIVTAFNPTAGTLTYSYTLPDNTIGNNAVNGGNTSITLSVTVTDADGDSDTEPFVITIIDDAPIARDDTDQVASGTLVATGNILTGTDFGGGDANGTDGVGDTPGADGAILTRIVSINVPANSDNDDTGGFDVVGEWGMLHVDTDGDYTYTRNAETPGGVEDSFTYTLTDGDGDVRTATLTIGIANSTPSGGRADVVLDDDDVVGANGLASGPGDLALLLPALPLPDPSQGDAPLTYSFPAPGAAPTGFAYDTATANVLKIYQGTVATGTLVVTVTLTNPATGAYTVVQNAPIAHAADNSGPDDNIENNQDFAITYQVKDADNQTATGTLNIRVNDDTPTATATASTTVTAVLDETSSTTTASTITTVAVKGDDPDVPNSPDVSGTGYISRVVTGGAVVNAGGAFGADGAAASNSLVYALTVSNAVSGLSVTDGSAISLVKDPSGVVVGVVQAGAFSGKAAFAISIDASTGVVTVEQYLSLQHPNQATAANGFNSYDEGVPLAAGSLGVTVARTDSDGDTTTSAAADISGQIRFEDDGPTTNNDTDTVLSGQLTASGNVLTGAGTENASAPDSAGADGGLVVVGLASNGNPVSIDTDATGGFDVTGSNGTLHVDANGAYTYTRFANPAGSSDIFTYTVKDGDGDQKTATLTIGIANSTPSGGRADVVLDDDDVVGANGLASGPGDLALLLPALPLPDPSQGDAPLTYSFPAPGAAPTGFAYDTATANVLKIYQGTVATGTLVVTVTLTNPATGAYTVVQNAPIAHAADNSGPDDNIENNQDFAITYQVKDADNQTATGTLNIRVNDDTPTATATASTTVTAVLDETSSTTTASTITTVAVKGDDPDVPNSPDVSGTGYISRVVTGGAVVNAGGAFGADGAAASNSLVYALTVSNAVSGLSVTDGSAISLVKDPSGVVVGVVQAGAFSGKAAFAISIDASTGVVTVEQYLSLQHPNQATAANGFNSYDEGVPLAAGSLGVTVARTDSDGDTTTSAAADISGQIRFEDDGPTTNNDTDTVLSGQLTASGNVLTGAGTENASAPDSAGADGGLVVVGLASNGNPVSIDTDATGGFDVTGSNGTLHVDANGAYTYTRFANPAGSSDIFTYTVKDGDGDQKTATLTIGIANSTPSGGRADVVLDDDDVVGANGLASGPGDLALLLPALPLPDPSQGDAPLTYSFPAPGAAPTGFAYDTATANVLKIYQGTVATGTLVVTVTLTNPATGAYTVVQNAPIAHAADNSGPDDNIENNQDFAITYQVKDADNQTATGTLNIRVNDDTPTATATASTTVTAVLDETSSTTTASTITTVAVKGDDPDVPNSPDVSGTGYISRVVTGGAVVNAGGAFGADGAAASNSLVYALTVSNAVSGLSVTDGSAISLVKDPSGVVVGVVQAGAFSGKAAFAISIDASTGVVTVEQYLSLQHPNQATAANGFNSYDEGVPLAAGSLGVTVARTDSDGDTTTSAAADISGQIRFEDDGPSFFGALVQDQQTDNNTGLASVATGTLHFAPGADGPGTAMTITANVSQLKVGGVTLSAVQNANVLTAYADNNGTPGFQSGAGGDTIAFTLTVRPGGGAFGTICFSISLRPSI